MAHLPEGPAHRDGRPESEAGPSAQPLFAKSIRVRAFEQATSIFADWQGSIEQISVGCFEGRISLVGGSILRVVESTGSQRLRVVVRDASGLTAIYPIIPGMVAGWGRGRLPSAAQVACGNPPNFSVSSMTSYSPRPVY